jgi:hypothetical protein
MRSKKITTKAAFSQAAFQLACQVFLSRFASAAVASLLIYTQKHQRAAFELYIVLL